MNEDTVEEVIDIKSIPILQRPKVKRGRPFSKPRPIKKVKNKKKAERILTREQEAELFKHLIDKTAAEAGTVMGLDKIYDTQVGIRMYVLNTIKRIKKAPELWGISPDAVALVQAALDSRAVAKSSNFIKEKEREEFKDRIEVIRDTAADILSKKLSLINRNRNTLEGVKLKEISDIMKDASSTLRLVKGESTDNVIHYSKIDLGSVTAEEAMALVLKAREAIVERNK